MSYVPVQQNITAEEVNLPVRKITSPNVLKDTVQGIKKMILEGREDLSLRSLAVRATKDESLPSRKALRIFEWIRQNIRLVPDIRNVEFVAGVQYTLKIGAGDCDDISVLVGAMLESIGFETRIHVINTNPDGEYNHVFVDYKGSDGEWTPCDPTRPDIWSQVPIYSEFTEEVEPDA
jgi:transglutaminase-like putative cysteine protease